MIAALAVSLQTDPGRLAETAEQRPELIDAVVAILRDQDEKQTETEQRAQLRQQLEKW